MNKNIPAFLSSLTALGVLILSFSLDGNISISDNLSKIGGLTLVYSGMTLVIWAAIYLRRGTYGLVQPGLESLVQKGPYRYARHPFYFGMSLALAGVAISVKSGLALLYWLLVYLPSIYFRAKAEEHILAEKFTEDWTAYENRTGFFIPRFRQKEK
ncbi:MAG: methyltransferase family protein [bacterium]